MASTPITRFYGFDPPKPFLSTINKEFPIVDMGQEYAITESDVEKCKCYLPVGTYKYVHNNTFFRKVPTVAASTLPAMHYSSIIKDVELRSVLPSVTDDSSLKTNTLTLVLSKNNRDKVIKIVQKTSSYDANECKAIFEDCMILQDLPEIGSTRGLGLFLQSYYGDKFIVSFGKCLLGKDLPFCMCATSQPDSAIYHKEKFVYKEIIQCAALIDHSYAADSSPTGSSREDKIDGSGETQCIAGLIQLTAKLGQKATIEKKFFTKAVVYGSVRQIDSDLLRPYKMLIDFLSKDICVLRSYDCIPPSQYVYAIKDLLEHP